MAILKSTQVNGDLTVTGYVQGDGSKLTNLPIPEMPDGAGGLNATKRAEDDATNTEKAYVLGAALTPDDTSNVVSDAVYSTYVYITEQGKLAAKIFYATSDARLKHNFEKYNPVKSILDLPIYMYDYVDGIEHQVGCLAQDLQKLYPEFVETAPDGYLVIQESKLIYPLLLEVKKLSDKVIELERRINAN